MDDISRNNEIQLKCPKGRPAEVACISDKCDHHAFCCKQTNCCQKLFKPNKCKFMKVDDLLKLHQNSCQRLNRIYKNTLQFFDNLKKMIESEVKNFKEWSEKSFAISKIFIKNDKDIIAAEELAKILEDLGEYNEQYFEDIAAYETLWDKNFKEQFAEMRLILCDRGHKKLGTEARSVRNFNDQTQKSLSPTTRIVWKQSEKQTLNQILKYLKNVQSVNLLFHAASHQFSISKFHELCDGIPNTLVIIRNQKQKTYGGFTPLPWGKSKFEKFLSDESLRTFVFSLTHKKKYLLKQSQKHYAIEWNNFFGPLFGRCNMIQVWDKANKQTHYWEHTPFSFKPPHGEWTNQMYEEMLGVRKYQEFKLLDWQVFEIIFN